MVSRSATAVFRQILTVLIMNLTADTFPVSVVGLMFLAVKAVLTGTVATAWSFRPRRATVMSPLVLIVLIMISMRVICLVMVVRSTRALVMILVSIVATIS